MLPLGLKLVTQSGVSAEQFERRWLQDPFTHPSPLSFMLGSHRFVSNHTNSRRGYVGQSVFCTYLYMSMQTKQDCQAQPQTLNTLFHVPFSFYTPYYYENILSCLPLVLEYENVFAVANDSS